MREVTKINLEKENSFALTTPGKIVFLLNCSNEELEHNINALKNEKEDSINDLPKTEKSVSIAIIPTYNCNLRCIYCYANGGSDCKCIDFKIAKKAIDYKRATTDANILDLYFVGGGEPLLYFEKVKEITEYANSVFKEVIFNVVTNGTGSKEQMDWLIKRDANVRISFDSINQKKQRPFASGENSHDIVVKNIKYLLSHDINLMVQCIITSDSVHQMREIIDELVSLNVKIVKFEPCLMTDVSRGNKSLQPDPILYATKLIDAIEYIANNDIDLMIDTGYFSKPMDSHYCGMANENFTVTPEGMITSCVEVSRIDEPYAEKVIFGKIKNKVMLNTSNIEFLKSLHYKNQCGGCCECELRFICLGGCPMANIWQNSLPLTKSMFTCAIEHAFLPKILTKIVENDKILNVLCESPEKDIEERR